MVLKGAMTLTREGNQPDLQAGRGLHHAARLPALRELRPEGAVVLLGRKM
jgi:hypothetical protein